MEMSSMKFLQLDDCQLAYHEQGTGESTMVLVHGNIANQSWWNQVVEPLSELGRVVTVDMRGVGQSTRPDAGYEIEQYAHDLLALLEMLESKQVTLVGHSLGGAIVMRTALLAPSMIERMILINSAPLHGLVTPEENYAVLSLLGSQRPLMEAALKGVAPAADHQTPFFQQIVDEAMRDAHVVIPNARSLEKFDIRQEAGKLTMPVYVIYGEQDLLVTKEMMQSTCELLPHGELIMFSHIGHSIMLEDPQQFVQVVKSTLISS